MPDVLVITETDDNLCESLVRLVDAAGTGLTGKGSAGGDPVTIKISKPGTAAFGAAGVGTALTEITGAASTGGMYRLFLGATDRNVAGDVGFEISHASIGGGAVYGVMSVKPATRPIDIADATLTAAKFAAGAFAGIADDLWEALGVDHDTPGTMGQIMQDIALSPIDPEAVAASVLDVVLDPDAPEGAQKLKEVLNIVASYVAGDGDGYSPSIAQTISYKKLGQEDTRLVGTVSGGKRTITKRDGA